MKLIIKLLILIKVRQSEGAVLLFSGLTLPLKAFISKFCLFHFLIIVNSLDYFSNKLKVNFPLVGLTKFILFNQNCIYSVMQYKRSKCIYVFPNSDKIYKHIKKRNILI